MRDIYKTAKEAQMAPVRGRVKSMMATPKGVPQARKIARQTTGFSRGGGSAPWLRGRSGSSNIKAPRGREGFKQMQQ